MYVRTRTDPATMANTVRRVLRDVDPTLAAEDMRTLNQQVDASLSRERLTADLSIVFSLLATLLAMVGLYGVLSYIVAQRTREIGVRMALGALSTGIYRLIMRDALTLVSSGVLIAIPVSWAVTRGIGTQLHGVSPMDPVTIGLAIALLMCVAMLAGFLPARRAARVDPVVALRYE
jgi:putative ABC transport system permease protein